MIKKAFQCLLSHGAAHAGEIKAFKKSRLRYWGLMPAFISMSFFPLSRGLNFDCFSGCLLSPLCHNHSPSNCVTSQNTGYKHFGSVLCLIQLNSVWIACMFHKRVYLSTYLYGNRNLQILYLSVRNSLFRRSGHLLCALPRAGSVKFLFDFLNARVISSSLHVKLRS